MPTPESHRTQGCSTCMFNINGECQILAVEPTIPAPGVLQGVVLRVVVPTQRWAGRHYELFRVTDLIDARVAIENFMLTGSVYDTCPGWTNRLVIREG